MLLVGDEVAAHVESAIARVETTPGYTWSARLHALEDCVATLPERSRELLAGRYEEGESAEAISARIGLQPATVRKQLQRLREALAECIGLRLRESTA
ncbi:RNA polymerase sigma factor [Botrimarina hoheduenensis]|uniref:RNA polymerase sigma factor n=1 Tax=Botrimarina hoheduenensis TaxID=2528000 RepID=A0A5C5WC17_9BACT|nr:RNA polymerase sigma factor [Botrimarina hoheduenensis]